MAFVDGNGSRFRIADVNGVARDLSAFITEVRGLPGARSLYEVTALGDSGARFNPSVDAVEFTLRGIYDDTTSAGVDVVLGALRYHTSPVVFEYAPSGFAASKPRYTGECWVRSYELASRAGGPVSWQATLQVEGVTTRIVGT
ncbi:MAG: hypothetical protein F4Y44_02845 [Chloroflexi bacterium]|nr:hypothetical protein [Chloroflexota bacterium]